MLYCGKWSQNERDSEDERETVEGEGERVDVENVAGDNEYNSSSDL